MSAIADDPEHFRAGRASRRRPSRGASTTAATCRRCSRERSRRRRRRCATSSTERASDSSRADGGVQRRAWRTASMLAADAVVLATGVETPVQPPYLAALAGDDRGCRGPMGAGRARRHPRRRDRRDHRHEPDRGRPRGLDPQPPPGGDGPRRCRATASCRDRTRIRGGRACPSPRSRSTSSSRSRTRSPTPRRACAPQATDWPRAVDSLRPISQALWMAMGDDLRRDVPRRLPPRLGDPPPPDGGGDRARPRRAGSAQGRLAVHGGRDRARSRRPGERLRITGATAPRGDEPAGLGGRPAHRRHRAQHGCGREPAARGGDRRRARCGPGPLGIAIDVDPATGLVIDANGEHAAAGVRAWAPCARACCGRRSPCPRSATRRTTSRRGSSDRAPGPRRATATIRPRAPQAARPQAAGTAPTVVAAPAPARSSSSHQAASSSSRGGVVRRLEKRHGRRYDRRGRRSPAPRTCEVRPSERPPVR